jgi:hypothetical protein
VLSKFIFCNHISELEMIGDEVALVCFNILTLLLPEETKENHESLRQESWVSECYSNWVFLQLKPA